MSLTKVTYSMIDGAVANVRDFGAIGDGVADDTAAIQAAIDSVNKLGTVFFPKGTYKITDTLNIVYSTDLWQAVNLIGVGNASVIDWRGGNGKSMIYARGISGVGWYSKQYIEKLHLCGNAFTGDPYSNVTAIQFGEAVQNVFSGVCNFAVRDCLIRRTTIGIAVFYESDDGIIDGNYIERFTGYGIYNYEGGGAVWITKNHISDGTTTSTGVYTSLSSGSIEQNVIQGSHFSDGVIVAGVGAFRGEAVSIRNNYFESQLGGNNGIILYGTYTAVIENNTFNGFPGANLIRLADGVDGFPCTNVTIGVNVHTQSGGFINSLALAGPNSVDCKITGYQKTDGAVTTISGPFQQIQNLNDYTESTFTAKLYFGATEQTVTSTFSYTKIGQVVYITGGLVMNAAVSGSGSATIQNLPYPVSAAAAKTGVFSTNTSNITNTGAISALSVPSTSTLQLYSVSTAGARTALTSSNFASNSELNLAGFYFVD